MSRLDPRTRRLAAWAVSGALVLAAGVVALSGGSGDAAPKRAGTPTATAPTATTTAPADPPVTVPDAPVTVPDAPATSVPRTPSAPSEPPTPALPGPRRVDPVKVLPVRPELSTVSWPDKARVAKVALAVGNEIARIDGRDRARRAALARMRTTVADSARARLDAVYATDPLPAGAPAPSGRVTALSLHDDPQTGARYATVVYFRIEAGRRHDGVMRLEFAPAQAVVTDYLVT